MASDKEGDVLNAPEANRINLLNTGLYGSMQLSPKSSIP